MKTIDKVLKGLMTRYSEKVPDVSKVTKALISHNIIKTQEDIKNDHIAFRTMGVPQLGIKSFEKIFLHYGYTPKDTYFFEHKKLDAQWYAPPNNKLPRIFISELNVKDLPKNIQNIITSYTDEVKNDPIDAINLDDASQVDHFLHAPLWRTPSYKDYKTLLDTSEYAAWVIYNRYYLNHYTISVDALPDGYNTLEEFNTFLANIGLLLSDAGGIIKESKDGLLKQSATVSQLCDATFAEGDTYKISGSYIEFAERKVLPEFEHLPANKIMRKHKREGFETGNADKIFESTFRSQTKRKK